MVYPEFCNVSANSARIEDRSDHVDDLPHAVTEPSLDAAIYFGLEVFQTLLAGCLHSEPSRRLTSTARTMQPLRPPEVKAEGLGERQRYLSRLTGAAKSPPPCPSALNSWARGSPGGRKRRAGGARVNEVPPLPAGPR